MSFLYPLALSGLALLLPGLVAIYFLRARYRRRTVSSLLLWRQATQPHLSGLRREKLRLPWLFLLELLIISSLVIAAAGPRFKRQDSSTLWLVFDPSASMGAVAADGRSAAERAIRQARQQGSFRTRTRIRILLARAAGAENLGAFTADQALKQLSAIDCSEPGDSLEATLGLVLSMRDPADEILILTDRAPAVPDQLPPSVRWLASGQPLPNRAITLAERTALADGRENLLIEVRRFGAGTAPVRLTISTVPGGSAIYDALLALNEEGRGLLRLELPAATPELQVEIEDDALALDNLVLLLPDLPRRVAARVELRDPALQQVALRALAATGRLASGEQAAELLLTDQLPAQPLAGAAHWSLIFVQPAESQLRCGPWLSEATHPLLEGVSFAGLTWPVGTNSLPGRALLLSDDRPLLSLVEPPRGAPVLYLVSRGAQDALFRSPAWPALVWNLVQAAAERQPGPDRRNLTAGKAARFSVDSRAAQAVFMTPDGRVELPAPTGRIEWAPPQTGRYRMLLNNREEPFVVNFIAPRESDLQQSQTGEW